MRFVKARLENSKETYFCQVNDNVEICDFVTDDDGRRLLVIGSIIDILPTLDSNQIIQVKRCPDYSEYKIIDIRSTATGETRNDGRYPLRIGRIVSRPIVYLDWSMSIPYLRDADGSDYSGHALWTSRVGDLSINEKGNLVITTMNSIYEIEPLK